MIWRGFKVNDTFPRDIFCDIFAVTWHYKYKKKDFWQNYAIYSKLDKKVYSCSSTKVLRAKQIMSVTWVSSNFTCLHDFLWKQLLFHGDCKGQTQCPVYTAAFLRRGPLEQPCRCEPLYKLLPCKLQLQLFFHLVLFSYEISPESCFCSLPRALWAYRATVLKFTMRTEERPSQALLSGIFSWRWHNRVR